MVLRGGGLRWLPCGKRGLWQQRAKGACQALLAPLVLGIAASAVAQTQSPPTPMSPPSAETARVDAQACKPIPLPGVTLYLRGGMNSWAPVDEYAFRWLCDAYVLNVDLRGRQEFKIADADWSPASNFGQGPAESLALAGGNVGRSFNGEHTLKFSFDGQQAQNPARLEIGPRSWQRRPASSGGAGGYDSW